MSLELRPKCPLPTDFDRPQPRTSGHGSIFRPMTKYVEITRTSKKVRTPVPDSKSVSSRRSKRRRKRSRLLVLKIWHPQDLGTKRGDGPVRNLNPFPEPSTPTQVHAILNESVVDDHYVGLSRDHDTDPPLHPETPVCPGKVQISKHLNLFMTGKDLESHLTRTPLSSIAYTSFLHS